MDDATPSPEPEVPLTGGNTADRVVRVRSTVRKPATSATPSVHRLLLHLHHAGCDAAPQVFGRDEHGRQVLEFVPGPLWHQADTHTASELFRVGGIIRQLHDLAATFPSTAEDTWNTRYQLPQSELVCHNDLAPWNLVCGDDDRWVFIDWDDAAPATRLWDLAWSCISFAHFAPGCDLRPCARAMGALLHGYGLEPTSYPELLTLMATRARAESDFIVQGAQAGQDPRLRLYREGHHQFWGPVADYLKRNTTALLSILSAPDERGRSHDAGALTAPAQAAQPRTRHNDLHRHQSPDAP